jgi:hypothetical protein
MKYKTKEKSFETLDKGAYSGHQIRKDYMIKNDASWKDLWNVTVSYMNPLLFEIYKPKLEAPEVDFSKDMVIAVYMGTQMTGGYGIEIKKILEKKKILEVLVEEHDPKPWFIYTQALTQPYHIIKTKTTKKKVKFKRVKE